MNQNIYIYNPSIKTGGTNNLLGNLTVLLANNTDYNIHYIDYQDSPVKQIVDVKTETVEFIEYTDERRLSVNNGLLIATLLCLKTLRSRVDISNNTRLLLWSTHPDDGLKLLPSFNLWLRKPLKYSKCFARFFHPFFKIRLKKLLVNGVKSNGIVWMDKINTENNKLFYNIEEEFFVLPVFTEEPNPVLHDDFRFINDSFKLVILGRLTDFKVYPLLGLLKQIARYQKSTGKIIDIDFIGDGPLKANLIVWLKELNLNYHFHGHIDKSDLDNVLKGYNLLLGMATSILESAKLNIPSVLIDASYDILEENQIKLRWLFELPPYEISRITTKNDLNVSGKMFSEIMDDIDCHEKHLEIAEKCFKHWELYHSPSAILDLVTQVIEDNQFYFTKENRNLLRRDITGYLIDLLKQKIK